MTKKSRRENESALCRHPTLCVQPACNRSGLHAPVCIAKGAAAIGQPVCQLPDCSCARTRSNTRQNAASCVVVKLVRISVQGWRLAWNRAPGASK